MDNTESTDAEAAQRPSDRSPAVPKIASDLAASFTYASFQSAIPVVRSIVVENNDGGAFENCRLELSSSPPFLRSKTWQIDRLLPGDRLPIADRKVDLDAAYLAGLDEAERGEITLRLFHADELLSEQRTAVRLLARDEWGGVDDMAQLLPAFVMPNDPAIASILRGAAERLAAHGHPTGLDGYQSESPSRAFMLTAAIYSSVAALAPHYAEPPASFESRGQKVRRPTAIASDRLATCLDTSLLFAAALEATGLHPVVLLFRGHAVTGVWLVRRTLANATEQDLMEVRKAIAARELIVFETTGVTHRPAMTLEAARHAVAHRLDEERARDFVAAIDVRRARSGGITPLASHVAPAAGADEAPTAGVELPLPPAPAFGGQPAEIVEQKPTTAQGRIDRWKNKLLDLTLRNRLLNLPDTKRTIPFLCTDVTYLEDRLAHGASIRVISLPEQNPLGERDPSLYRDVHGRDLQRSFAAEALQRDELASTLGSRELDARLTDLYRQVRNDLAEGGANTLFLAVGFLRWKKKPDDERSYRAPLLLVPVKLERRSASSTFTLRFHEDEPRFNATLLQFLERDFDLRLHQFAGPLPLDETGVDVQVLLALARQAVRDVPGMEVVDETALSTFSFAKFLMWKDLAERVDALRENRVVRHLIDNPERAFEGSGIAFPEGHDLDRRYAPADIVSLLPADSSQTAAALAAAEGRDFVIVGPPGTGKSQTIANMIANCLAAGRSVLFVAEKAAALDVVYRRLREHGLGPHCIELHSNKADRRHFLGQLRASWEHGRGVGAADWITVNERLRVRRDELNAYVEALHRRHPNGWTAYTALGIALKSADALAPALAWPAEEGHDEAAFLSLEELAARLGLVFAHVEREPSLALVDVDTWSSAWQADLVDAAAALGNAIDLLLASSEAFLASLELAPRETTTQAELEALLRLAEALEESRGRDVGIAFDPDLARCRDALAELAQSIDDYGSARRGLSAAYLASSMDDIDPDSLERQWREAEASFWPSSLLGKRKVQALLQGHVECGTADPQIDLPLLRTMKACRLAAEANPLSAKAVPFAGLDTDVGDVAEMLRLAESLRAALHMPDRTRDEMRAFLLALKPSLGGTTATDRVRQAAGRFRAALNDYDAARRRFGDLAGCEPPASLDGYTLSELRASLVRLADARHLLRDWSDWCQVRRQAIERKLGPLVDAIEDGSVPGERAAAAFRLAYAWWWLPTALDADPVLRGFRRFRHENTISEFRELDDLVRAQATRKVISALAHGLPDVQSVPRNSELGLLRHQMELQRPSRSIRDMIGRLPQSFPKLAPCMLMSPLSIAQYLPPGHALFDVVIFDEASQITTWDAVGAISRARQTIIVGDPRQLPPTNFFGRNDGDDDLADHETDLESILDEAKAAGIPTRDLRWHYRSRSESLIAFSNHHYYGNRLVTFPSPAVDDRAVRLRKVPNGVYDRGKSRANRIEAEAVAAEAVAKMRSWLVLAEKDRPTLGVITFNAQQQSLILDLLDAARRAQPELEWFFGEDRIEPTIVKNLENVQGDERDFILFSITFWKDASGRSPSMDFGALNRDGGERRLNVAVTRARQELLVFSGFTADQIDLTRTKALAVRHLKTFLDYAERGAIALPAQEAGSVGGFDSPFEEAVADALERYGWSFVPQVGISGFRVDLGVRHPDLPGAYLAGVECDGATYHRSATARDRDKVREQVLSGLGWTILRVWSTDWWFDPKGCSERLQASLEALLEAAREKRAAEPPSVATHWDLGHEVEPIDDPPAPPASVAEEEAPPPATVPVVDLVAVGATADLPQAEGPPVATIDGSRPASVDAAERYRLADLSAFNPDADRFFDLAYRPILAAMVEAVLEIESPLKADALAQRVARAHGWLRTGARIRERIDLHLRGLDRTVESSGEFVWKKGTTIDIMPYRRPADAESRRSIADIPLAELAAVVVANPALLDQPDPARDLARLLGVERLAATARSRLEEAIDRARPIVEELGGAA